MIMISRMMVMTDWARLALAASMLVAITTLAQANAQAQTSDAVGVPGKPALRPRETVRASQATAGEVSEVIVTASRRDLLGEAMTASQGSVTREEVVLRPIYRIGQLYETVPGLVVTIHSGEGKAGQYLMRGFNLDHGTDFASFVDGMPVNRPTNAHGQGYSDQNFLIPQIVGGLDYTKGPYDAAIGDFGAVGSAHVHLQDDIADQVSASVGTLRDDEAYVGGTYHMDADDRLWGALDVTHLDGPWDPPSHFNKINLASRLGHGDDANGYSLTGMYYQSAGLLETDQSIYALQEGLIGRYGTLDPTDASRSQRYSLSGHYGRTGDGWAFAAGGYAIDSTMTLFNNFTHYLFDNVEGDQEEQDETRTTLGGEAALTLARNVGAISTETVFGLQDRYDIDFVDRRHTHERSPLNYCELDAASLAGDPGLRAAPAGTPAAGGATPYVAVGGYCSADHVRLNDLGAYAQTTTRWTRWFRTVIGFREEVYAARDHSVTTGIGGAQTQTLPQPKGSLILGPWLQTEVYLSAGRGFHSNDAREVFLTVPYEGPNPDFKAQLLSPAIGEEVGLRTNLIPKVQAQIAVFQEDFNSEQLYDQDQGEDQASAATRRQGVEVSAEYHPFRWVELNADLDFAKARYRDSLADLQAQFGLDGDHVANAPSFTGTIGVIVDNLGPWFGGLQVRDLGPYPIMDGEAYPRDKGYAEVNLDVGYRVSRALMLRLGVYNLLNSQAHAAAYDYTSRLVPNGPEVTGPQVHPLEPISARLMATATF
jgi:outer membrane cobalamin receptor